MSLLEKIDKTSVPKHIAIIMDGNGRWAKAHGLGRAEGHKEGVISVRKVVEAAVKANVKFLTIYVFSTENWKRPEEEINALMELMVYAVTKETPDLIENQVKVKNIGDITRLPEKTKKALEECEVKTSKGNKLTLILALSYSSRWEIVEAAKKLIREVGEGKIKEEEIDESLFSDYLSTKGIPDPDLVIRTGGEQRMSNFLLWQSAYAELYFTDTFWPAFREEDLYAAIIDYQHRERRFGKISEQIESAK
ncbi:isoprenyl transferase [Anaerorudis cellulosivorans]|uniref:isoprenyl transferase n=1 Tax=Anaerorudis cellulosivorans TaxID=3397862 RepID=UPI00222044B8|nr:isoprenyl transferase [Seramator thermalis]MCW1734692.1 isoprenyl transferase [Seramator thermalis]